ncbi:hypothetical protein E4U55_002257, partial [Claviceps digitariae]
LGNSIPRQLNKGMLETAKLKPVGQQPLGPLARIEPSVPHGHDSRHGKSHSSHLVVRVGEQALWISSPSRAGQLWQVVPSAKLDKDGTGGIHHGNLSASVPCSPSTPLLRIWGLQMRSPEHGQLMPDTVQVERDLTKTLRMG